MDTSGQGEFLISQWLSRFRPGFGPKTFEKVGNRFGHVRISEGVTLNFSNPSSRNPDLKNKRPGPGRSISYVRM